MTHDDQAQVRLQAAIEKSAREWQLTFDSVDTGIMILGGDGNVVRLNRAVKDLLGKRYQEVLGEPIQALGPGKLWSKAADLWRHVRATRSSASGQTCDEATGQTWDITGNPIIEAGVEHCRTILLIRDITKVVELQASLYRSETMAAIGALVAGVCHEVRNPLFGISATLDAFEERFGKRDEYAEYLVVLRKELTRMNDLMRDLLEYSRPPSHSFSPDSIENVIAQAVHTCRLLAKEAGVRIVNDVKRGLAPVLMERRRLLQVFQNLIENAVQHSSRGECVTVTASVLADAGRRWIWCAVQDTGPGFRDEDLPKIFQPFYTKRRGGTGLGLSIVQRIVEQHGGSIRAGNRIGGGAIVSVRLPCVHQEGPRTGAGDPRGEAPHPHR
jgi:PAS domain S-box-containing protein